MRVCVCVCYIFIHYIFIYLCYIFIYFIYVYTYVAKKTGRVPSHRLLPIFDCLMVTHALGHMRMVMPKYMNYHEAIGRLEINAGRAHCLFC